MQLHTSFAVVNELWMVLDYMDRGSCLDQLNARKEEKDIEGFGAPEVKWILRETLKALMYLHQQNMIHRDIKV